MFEILKKLAELNYSDERGNPGFITKLPSVEKLEDGYVYHEEIGVHHFGFHVIGNPSSCAVSIEEIEVTE